MNGRRGAGMAGKGSALLWAVAVLVTLPALGGTAVGDETPAGKTVMAPAAPAPAAPAPAAPAAPTPAARPATAATDGGLAVTAPAAATAPVAPKAPAAPIDPVVAAAQRAAALRKKVLKDDDFAENDEVNRDPFHSYLRLFIDKGSVKTRKVPAIFEKLGLDELSLIAVVSGDSAPRAMFRDPSGLGETVKMGDYLSKAGARVTKILSDRVVVELMESNAKGEPHPIEKAIFVNPDEGAR
jgi:Tfp pilus assembly protein PilP